MNLFHRSEARVRRIRQLLERVGARDVLGERPNARVPGLESKRALSHREGVFGADVVLVPLEDGDRAEALVRMKKVVISVDLNPFSRTTRMASIPVVDEVSRALLNIHRFVHELRDDGKEVTRITRTYDKDRNMAALYSFLRSELIGMRAPGGMRARKRR